MGLLTLHIVNEAIFRPIKENKFQYVIYHKFFAPPIRSAAEVGANPSEAEALDRAYIAQDPLSAEQQWEKVVFYRMADIWRGRLSPSAPRCDACGKDTACAARHTYAGPCGGGSIAFRSAVGTNKDLSVVLTAKGDVYTELALVEIVNRLVEVLAAACDGKLSAASLTAASASSESRKAKCVVAIDEMFFGAHLDTTDVDTILKASKLKV